MVPLRDGEGEGARTSSCVRARRRHSGISSESRQLSVSGDGPGRARDFLAQHGIGFEYLPHLPRTHLDGAAIKLDDGRPVIGMTLRYDRIDNFWYTLLHELSHVGLHLDGCGDENAFVDDHTLRGIESGGGTQRSRTLINGRKRP